MNIGLFTSVYFNNIGNGFLDLGAEYELNKIESSKSIVKVSQCANFAASLGKLFALKQQPVAKWAWTRLMESTNAKAIHNKAYDVVRMERVISPASMFRFDYFIIPGCVLTIHFFKIYYEFLLEKKKQGAKLVFLGVGGNYYTNDEISFVSNCLKELKPYALISRDTISFEHYSKYACYAFNGIDNAFYVNRLGLPSLNTDFGSYVVINLEGKEHEMIKRNLIIKYGDSGTKVLFSDHCPTPYTKVSKLVKNGDIIISDYPMDYLVLYKNATSVYTDRIHACITSLSFGTPVNLYSNSPRKALLDNIGVHSINEKLIADPNALKTIQDEQIDFIKGIID